MVEPSAAAPCVGLFGTCGGSTWRDRFMREYEAFGIQYFNPQVDDWKPEDAKIEARHLASDQIVLFPITGETYGMGSLSETGFSALQAIKLDSHRFFVVMIEHELSPELDDPAMRKESIRARALVSEHLRSLRIANLYFVDSLDTMLQVSLELHDVALTLQGLEPLRSH